MLERLQKLISQAGITSRRAAEELIVNGRVTVNGVIVTELGSKADPATDRVAVDGKPLQFSEKHLYILLNKPTGYITALKDSQDRPLVTDLLKGVEERVYPVGRLDYNTEGLLLLTNDGDWANRLMHPRHEVEKEYHVRVRGKVLEQQLKRMAGGVELEDGVTAPATVRMVKSSDQNDWISVTIHEGRNRQVRRMCEVVSLSVVRLRRVRYGSLEIGALKPGQFRYLTDAEVQGLLQPGGISEPEPQKVQKPRPPRSTNSTKTGTGAPGSPRKPQSTAKVGTTASGRPQKPRGAAKNGTESTGRPPARTAEKQTKRQPSRTKPGESPRTRHR
ncbi:pseudouridine synthase [Oryzomonas japonica]|uniref:Pseudouridine synthase n=1 Tax=Oryzomonas japonica TaxID=2603858 RepID=A0A7J4ZQZ0_9BACT|nr:pseudouridine synthase [Oryzomonas japonica]